MAHAAPPSPRRRTFERLVGGLLALAAIVLAVIAVIALRHPQGAESKNTALRSSSAALSSVVPSQSISSTQSASVPPVTVRPTTSSPKPKPTVAQHPIPLVVLSNTGSMDPATLAAQRFRAGGWKVTDVSLFDGDILSSVAYYDPSVSGAEAAALALQKQFPALQRVKEKFDGLPDGPIVVVLTTDYS